MREIKFRGMDVHGIWRHGNLAILPENVRHLEKGHYISNKAGSPFAYAVRPETVGQYTGLKDKNGNEIYEGDIDSEFDEGYRYVVFKDGAYGLQYHDDEKSFDPFILWDQVEIIGNIYEHPHLLGGSE